MIVGQRRISPESFVLLFSRRKESSSVGLLIFRYLEFNFFISASPMKAMDKSIFFRNGNPFFCRNFFMIFFVVCVISCFEILYLVKFTTSMLIITASQGLKIRDY